MAIANFVPQEQKTSIIKITSYEGKNLQGYLFNPYYEQVKEFNNLIQLLFIMEDLQKSLSYPQESMEPRSFVPTDDKKGKRASPTKPQIDPDKPVLATFKLSVLFKQNASWQGNIIWVEQETEAQFRSVLEMIMLLDSVLTATQ